MSFFLDLPPELCEEVLKYCQCEELQGMVCSNTLYALIQPILWRTIGVGRRALLLTDWNSREGKAKLKNFKYTRALRFFDCWKKEPDSTSECEDEFFSAEVKVKVNENISMLVRHCNPEILQEIFVDPFMVLGFYHGQYVDAECLQVMCGTLSGLKYLCLQSVPFSDGVHRAICGLKHMVKLSLHSDDIEDRHVVEYCNRLPNLKELNMHSPKITDEGFRDVYKLTQIEGLYASSSSITDKGILYISKATTLQHLNINSLRCITHHSIKYLEALPTLKELNIHYCNLSDSCIPSIRKITSLRKFGANNCKITDQGMKSLLSVNKSFSSLTLAMLDLSFEGIAPMSHLASLKELDLSNTSLNDKCMYELRKLTSLEELNISRTAANADALQHLGALTSLKTLHCDCTDIEDNGIPHLASLSSLKELHLSDCHLITDKALAHISKMSSLNYLNLYKTKTTDEGCKMLCGLPSLKVLIANETYLTDDGVWALCNKVKTLRELEISDNNNITDLAMTYIANHSSLQYININRTRITDFGLKELCTLGSLRTLECIGNVVSSAELLKFPGMVELICA